MESKTLITKGLEIADFYYSAKRYFNQLFLLTEGISNLLIDKGWKVTSWMNKRPVSIISYLWSNDRSNLTKSFSARFEKEEEPNIKYGFSIFFFNYDPLGEQQWVPSAYFFRVKLIEDKSLDDWKVDPKIAQYIRPILLSHSVNSVFIETSEPWPKELSGDGVDNQIQSISIVPFPLASIENSEDLEYITTKAINALSENNPKILANDEEYLTRVWELTTDIKA